MSDQVTINTTPESGPNAPEQNTPAPFTPEENPADLAKSYAELRAKFTQTSQELSALKKGQQPAVGDTAPNSADDEAPDPNGAPDPLTIDENKEGDEQQSREDAAKQVADKAGFDLTPYNMEYEETGDVSEENRVKIAEGLANAFPKGTDVRALVDQFIDGSKHLHANDRNLAYQEAGGEDAYKNMIMWAKDALPKDEIAAYNRTVNSGDRHARLLAVRGLRAKFESENGRIPDNVMAAGGGTGAGAAPYSSAAEMVRDMQNPLYQTDPAFRDKVRSRIAASPNL